MNIDQNIQKILFALMSKWKLLVIFAIIGGILGYVYTHNFTTLTYTSNVEFLAYAVDSEQEINDSNFTTNNANANRVSNTSKMNYAMKMIDTYVEIFKTNEFNSTVAKELNERLDTSYSTATVKDSTVIETVEDTAIFKISVTTTDPNLSYEIAHQLETSIPKAMENANNGLVAAQVQDKALRPNAAQSLGYPKKIAFGAVIGMLLAAAYVILRNLLDIRIKTDEELIEKYNIPVLGTIPNFTTKTNTKDTKSTTKTEQSNAKGVENNG